MGDVVRCLEKRYESAEEVVRDVQGIEERIWLNRYV